MTRMLSGQKLIEHLKGTEGNWLVACDSFAELRETRNQFLEAGLRPALLVSEDALGIYLSETKGPKHLLTLTHALLQLPSRNFKEREWLRIVDGKIMV